MRVSVKDMMFQSFYVLSLVIMNYLINVKFLQIYQSNIQYEREDCSSHGFLHMVYMYLNFCIWSGKKSFES